MAGMFEHLYKCCQQAKDSFGCKNAKFHVFHDEPDSKGFIQIYKKTLFPEISSITDNAAIYGMDCEMVYTNLGSELARVSLVDRHLLPILDMIIKPRGFVIDPNTEFSGLTEKEINGTFKLLRLFWFLKVFFVHNQF